MNIEKDVDYFIENTLQDMRLSLPPVIEEKCFHCGLIIRFPLVARQRDIDIFKSMLDATQVIMKKHNIDALILSEIKAECYIQIAKKKSKKV